MFYLIQASNSAEAWANQIGNPQDIVERITPTVEELGGRVDRVFYSFGEYDVVAILEFPDNVSVAAMSVVASATGATRSIKTTPLMTIEEGMKIMTRAGEVAYRPPGA